MESILSTGITFFIILSILVFIHELGHFLVAKWAGILVEEFGFGLPPRLFGIKVGDTIYSINWLPIGGFVKLYGEDADEPKKTNVPLKRSFTNKSKKIRAAILVAGVCMNFVLAVGITTYLLISGVPEPSGKVHIERVQPGSPAQEVGLQEGDTITAIEGQSIIEPKDLIDATKKYVGTTVTLTIIRNSKEMEVHVLARKEPPQGQGSIGVAISDLQTRYYPVEQAPVKAVKINVWRAGEMLKGIGTLLWKIVTLQKVQEEVAGPIGIAAVTGEAVKFGFKAVLEFMSILSLNLAVINILPIPALDGGRLAFLFAEKLLGRKLRPAFEQKTHQVGMIILIFLILLISINDILRLARGS